MYILCIFLNNSLGGMKFGIDSNGNYGYIKAGADSVTPFSSNPLGDDYFYMIGSKLAIELSGNTFVPNNGAFKLTSRTAGNYFHTVSTKVDITKYKTLEMKYSLYNHNGYTNNSKAIVVLKKNKPASYTDAKTIESGDILLLETNMDSGTMHDKTIDLSAYSGEYYLTYYLYQNYTGFTAGIYTQFLRMK